MTEKIAILGKGVTAKSVADYAEKNGIPICDPDSADLIIASPGIPPKNFPETKVPIISDIEWAYRLFQKSDAPPKLIAVTGTNGKSTVTTMISHILDIPYAGNIGIPLINYVGLEHEFPEIVVELSSFQLETCSTFTPDISVFLNLSPDHLSRHKTFKEYANQKLKCFQNQDKDSPVIYNKDDAYIPDLLHNTHAKLIPFSEKEITDSIRDLKTIYGKHNHLNVLASLKVAECTGMSEARALQQLLTYKPLRHRLEETQSVEDRRIINDSKATNPDSTIQALQSFTEPTWLLLCGQDKSLDTDALIESILKRAKGVVCFGELASSMQWAIKNASPTYPVFQTETMQEAFRTVMLESEPGDLILFSPSSSSMDQFTSFEDRGNQFIHCVMDYAEALLV